MYFLYLQFRTLIYALLSEISLVVSAMIPGGNKTFPKSVINFICPHERTSMFMDIARDFELFKNFSSYLNHT